MNDYAVIKINHRQYIIEPSKTYTVDKFVAEAGEKVTLDVLARGKDGKFEVGTPTLDKVKAEIEILDQGKGEKVSTFIYKAKSRYRRRSGLRPRVTTFKVLSIK
jgi:large subunit ribosomal protein L21